MKLHLVLRILLYVSIPFLFILSFAAMFWGMMEVAALTYKQQVRGSIPDSFPVLVVSWDSKPEAYRAKVVEHGRLREYTSKSAHYSFQVPNGDEAGMNGYLDRHAGGEPYTFKGDRWIDPGRVQVKKLADGRQLLKVERSWDDDWVNASWYEAKGQTLKPLYYQCYRGPSLVFQLLPLAAVGNVIGWIIGLWVYRRRKNHADTWRMIAYGFLRWIGWAALFVASTAVFFWIAECVGYWMFVNGLSRSSVTRENIWYGAPVLIVSPVGRGGEHKAVIEHFGDLDGYMKEHPGSTFQVPPGKELKLNQQLKTPRKDNGLWQTGSFDVQERSDGKQYLRVTGGDPNPLQISWYEADEQHIWPRYWASNWETDLPVVAFMINGAAWLMVGIWWKKRRGHFPSKSAVLRMCKRLGLS